MKHIWKIIYNVCLCISGIVVSFLRLHSIGHLSINVSKTVILFIYLIAFISIVYIPVYHLFLRPKRSSDYSKSYQFAEKRINRLWNKLLAIPFYVSVIYFIGAMIYYFINPPHPHISDYQLYLLVASLGYIVFYLVIEIILLMWHNNYTKYYKSE